MSASINAMHRRHYKSGSCLQSVPLDTAPFHSKKFRRLLDWIEEQARRRELKVEAESTLIRPEYFERIANPRSTQSIFGRIASKVMGLFGKRAA